MLGRAIVAFAFVWLMAPLEPNLGLACPRAALCGSANGHITSSLVPVLPLEVLNELREEIFTQIDRVRADFRTNLNRSGSRAGR